MFLAYIHSHGWRGCSAHCRAEDLNVVIPPRLVRLGQLAVAAAIGGESMTEPRACARPSRSYDAGGCLTGTAAVVMTASACARAWR